MFDVFDEVVDAFGWPVGEFRVVPGEDLWFPTVECACKLLYFWWAARAFGCGDEMVEHGFGLRVVVLLVGFS